MKKYSIFLICLLASIKVLAADSLTVALNNTRFKKGDTISFDCIYKYTEKKAAASTLNVWIEDIEKNRKWQYRYPLVNGKISANLIVSNDLPDGKYALNFLVQNQFFGIKGIIKDYNPKAKNLIYLMLTKDKASYIDNVKPNVDGSFSLPRLQFADSARFIFSEVGKKRNDMFIDIATPLDSAFTPLLVKTQIITVGDTTYLNKADSANTYTFNEDIFRKPFTLIGVTVKATKKKKIQLFDEEYSSGLFSGGDAKIFNGIDDNDIASSTDIFNFLQGRVAGLKIGYNAEGGLNVTWRGGHVAIYLDEFKLDADDPTYINPSDVAMIKVFPPNSGGPTSGGTIAIYSKRGAYADNSSRKYNFMVRGFTAAESIWK
ncbi:MAG: hypothetical protein H7178_10325 [Chitinophagaceae bacterium]|nr:hypothetical protein [Chitinophagaceae bacterium]